MSNAAPTSTPQSVDVFNLQGESVGSVDLPAEWFDGTVNVAVMHEVVTAQLAAARQGTHKTKTRGEVRGGGRKPWRQKGTGRARQGSIRSPQWVGGGVAHGRVPKDWSKRVNKKLRRAALRSALTDRAQSDAVIVVRELAYATPRTKDATATLAALGRDTSTLVVLADWDPATVKSFRNLQNVHVLVVDQLNTYDVIRHDALIIDEAALTLIGTGRRAGTATVEDAAEQNSQDEAEDAAEQNSQDEAEDAAEQNSQDETEDGVEDAAEQNSPEVKA